MMEGNKKSENVEAAQTPIGNGAKSVEQSNLEENKNLKLENLELKKKLKVKDKLIHFIGHDLINKIGGSRNLLEAYKDDIDFFSKEEISDGINILYKDSEKTYKLLKNVLDLAYAQNNEIMPEILKLNLLEQVKDSIDPLLEIAKQKNINFNTSGINEKIEVLADSKMLQAVIRNLSSNAIKFTNIGGNIFINSQKVNDNIELSVIDDGIGLSEKEMDKLFEKIGETRNGTNKETGTGFGLHLCKELVDEMRGTIRVESVEGHGAKFIVSLPEAGN